MTDRYPDVDQRELLRDAAAAHSSAVRDLEAFLRRLPEVPDPADITEYANLLTREEQTRAERQAAASAVGLELPSLGTEA
ncbi:hypothetical protein [Micromonospora sp. DPT]|uniref:hypothetical protein n=1 Tax=Micromonospora sp. DPT TaxID=3142975 RepID=UPI003208AB38